jgi:hypothetical protein
VFLLFLHADTHCLLGGPTGVENPGTSPFIRFGHPSANRNSDLIAVSDGNTALRKSGKTMGIRTIRRTNWVGNPRLGSLRHSWYGLESLINLINRNSLTPSSAKYHTERQTRIMSQLTIGI